MQRTRYKNQKEVQRRSTGSNYLFSPHLTDALTKHQKKQHLLREIEQVLHSSLDFSPQMVLAGETTLQAVNPIRMRRECMTTKNGSPNRTKKMLGLQSVFEMPDNRAFKPKPLDSLIDALK